MRIIVTGGAGFIGSHISQAYVDAGHDVVAIDSLWSQGGGRREHVPERANFAHMDIRGNELERIFREFQPELVSHHAAQHSVAIGARDPKYDAEVNVLGLLNVLECCVRANVKKVIFASSAATYGDIDTLPFDELTPQRPVSPYGITKMVAEHYLRFFKSDHGLDYTILRYGNVYGPRQDPLGEAGVIAIFIGRFLAGQGVRIDWDGEQTRDYVYVDDVAALNVAALERGRGATYVVGSGKRTSVNDIYAAIAKATGFQAPIERAARRPGDARDVLYKPVRVMAELGWKATTPLDDGIERTVEYFRRRMAA
jgi:UDP-glucose 4-epimerase